MKIGRIELVSAFERNDSVLLTHGGLIKAVADQYRGRAHTVNVPDRAPPELPRLFVQFEDAVLQVGLNRFQLVMQPPTQVESSYDDAMHFARDRAIPLFTHLVGGASHDYQWSGVVAEIEVPQDLTLAKSALGAVAPAYARLTRLKWDPGALIAFRLQAGYLAGSYARIFTVSGYERRTAQFPMGARPIRIDPSESVLEEVGVNVILDVNNKPATAKLPAIPDLEATLDDHRIAFGLLRADLNMDGLL